MQTFQYGFTCLLLVLFSKTAHSDIGTPCPNSNECVTGERCNATPECECDTDISYQDGPVQTTKCFLAKDLGVACTTVAEKDECMLGNGGTGAICSATQECVCDTDYVEHASTCNGGCGTPPSTSGYNVTVSGDGADTGYGAAAAVACATGYTGTTAWITCQAGGTWDTPSGCNIEAKNLGENCNIDDQCVAGDGGSGAVCDTTCKIGNGASEIRQRFSIVVLIGVLFLALV